MSLQPRHSLLRILVNESSRFDGRPAWQAAIEHLRLEGLAGATAYRGCAGFTGGSVATDAIEVLSTGLPIVIDAVDAAEKIEMVVDDLCRIVGDHGLVTRERVEVVYEEGKT